ncbi:ATP-binding protein [Brevundimonas sp.]|uniref:sensor histidine kinase n=1 Tax=Brevundimonas sp. TaxID=1871086 RepID=UPI002ABAF4BE|nr:ATP-binding protein [Brevundimonas sp.]MDZ4365366.1 ATP-binding protein [Brevundimonas sp.]
MPVSPALDLNQPVPAHTAKPAVGGRVAAPVAKVPGFFAQPLAPMATVVGVVLLVVLAISFARSAGVVAALWGASGLAVAVWLRHARDTTYDLCFAALISVGILAGEFLVGNPPDLSLIFTLANMIEIVTAVVLVRRFAPTLNLSSVDGAGRFLLCAAVLAPLPAALFSAIVLQSLFGANFLDSFHTWWMGHAMGMAVIATFGVALTPRHLSLLKKPIRVLEAIFVFGGLTAVSWALFCWLTIPAAFSIIPILILVAVRFRVLGIATGLVIVSVMAVGGAMLGFGPFALAELDLAQRTMLAQVMVLLGCMPVLLVASILEERDRMSERARAAQTRAERASEAKSRLLANVAHEIKSPVGGIIGIGELWQTGQLGPVTDTQTEMAAMLVKTARQVEALTHDLLDVARAESGAVRVDLRPTDVRGVLEDVRRGLALRPDAAGLRLEVLFEGDGLVALADSQRLSQVIGNLASNAVKYGASGGVVTFRASRIHDGVRIEVVDNGPGLSIEKQTQLFEPFNRLGLERSTVEGHGIGLALAKRMTELQGGSIGVESVPGHGATFWIELQAA